MGPPNEPGAVPRGVTEQLLSSAPLGAWSRGRAARRLAADGSPDAVTVLARAARSAGDPRVRAIADEALRGLGRQDAVDALVSLAISGDDEDLLALVEEAGHRPSDAATRAALALLAGRLEDYDDLDVDGSLLRAAHTWAPAGVQRRLTRAALHAGRIDVVGSLGGGRPLDDAEMDAATGAAAAAGRWEELWALAQTATTRQAAGILRELGERRWRPSAEGDGARFDELVRRAAATRSVVPTSTGLFGEPRVHPVGGMIMALGFSADGEHVVSGLYDGSAEIRRVADGRRVATLPVGGVTTVTTTPDGTLALTGEANGTIRLWRLADGTPAGTLTGHRRKVLALAVSPDGALLASGGYGTTIRLWRLPSGEAVGTMEVDDIWVPALRFSPDGTWLFGGGQKGNLRRWKVRSTTGRNPVPATFERFAGHSDHVACFAILLDEKTLVSGSYDHTVRFWRISDGRPGRLLTGHTNHVRAVAASPDGELLVSAGEDAVLRFWDPRTGRSLGTLAGTRPGERKCVDCLAISPDGRYLINDDGGAIRWSSRERSPVGELIDTPIPALTDAGIDRAVRERPPYAWDHPWPALARSLFEWRIRHDVEVSDVGPLADHGVRDIEIEIDGDAGGPTTPAPPPADPAAHPVAHPTARPAAHPTARPAERTGKRRRATKKRR